MHDLSIEERKATADRVAASPRLTNSPKLRSFFLYVVDCAIRESPEEATEQQIGIHVFGRRPGYSSGDDSIVRSQARLLRQKLSAYYAEEGAEEPLLIEMPKGHYLPLFRTREVNPLPPTRTYERTPRYLGPTLDSPVTGELERAGEALNPAERVFTRRLGLRFVLATLFAVLTAFALGVLLGRRASPSGTHDAGPLWSAFLQKPKSTLVIFSNPLFEGDPNAGLHLVPADLPHNASAPTDETYTGTGEVGAVYQITRLFTSQNAEFTLKRSQLVTWDEARSSNLIFIGAASQNTALHELPGLAGFTIALDRNHQGYIVNQHPQPGEPARFPYEDKTQETAIFANLPGLEPGTHILIFTGLTTVGTQAAVEFACRPENIAMIARQAGTTNGQLNPFEAVLQVGISKGVGVSTKLLLLHRR